MVQNVQGNRPLYSHGWKELMFQTEDVVIDTFTDNRYLVLFTPLTASFMRSKTQGAYVLTNRSGGVKVLTREEMENGRFRKEHVS